MYRKILSLILVLTLAVALAACNSSTESETTTDPAATVSGNDSTDPQESTVPDTTPDETVPGSTAMILIDNEYCTVKITEFDASSIWGYAVNVYLENKTDQELMFTVDSVSVNGYMCDPFWATSVASQKKANSQIGFSSDDFETNGIETVTDITFTLRVYDSEDWLADDIVNQTFTVNP